MADPCVIGVDLGGTNVRARAYYADGTPAGDRAVQPSSAQDGTAAVLAAVASTVREALASATAPPLAVGLAVPGHIDGRDGVVIWAPNFGEERDGVFYNWTHVPLSEPLGRDLGIPVYCGNDANLAALGEYRFGVGRNAASCLVLLTIGTGIGGGVVLRPAALQGNVQGPVMLLGGNQGGAELGHMVVAHGGLDCNAGTYGALEAYCQRDAIVNRAVHRLKRGRPSILRDLTRGDWSQVTPELCSRAAAEGDELAIEVWSEVGTWLGVAIGSLINIFAPDVFAIGGQIANAGDWLLEPARRAARNIAIPSLFQDTSILKAEQIDEAGILGGAALALEAVQWKTA